MEREMEFSDGEDVSVPQYTNRSDLMSINGNSAIRLENQIERKIEDHEQQLLPGYIFMCNGRTKLDCYRYRVFGIPRGRKDIVESIKPGMKLFLYDFEKRLLYGVYEATMSGKLDIEPEAFDKKYPAQVRFRIVKNCYPLPENTFKSAIFENYKGVKFKQELAPHQVNSLLSLFRSFTAPELDSLSHRLASRASVPRELSFEERFIAATQLRNASSVLDPLLARYVEPRLGSLMAHQSVPRASLLEHSYSRKEDYSREALSLSNLNQPYFPTESRQHQLPEDTSRSSIQDPQLKYLTILSNIRRYGTAPEHLASENEYYPATSSEKDQFASPYSDNKYYPSTSSGNEHPSTSATNGGVYRSDFYTSTSQKEGEASQQHEIPAGTYYNPEASRVPNTTVAIQSHMQAANVAQSAGYPTPAHGEAPQSAAGTIGYTYQPQSVMNNSTAYSQPGSVGENTQSYVGIVSQPQQQYYAATVHTTQLYAGGSGYLQQPHETGYSHAAATGYAQQPDAAATGYSQAQQPHDASTGYGQQPHSQAVGYTMQPYAQAVGYTPQYHTGSGPYTQQAVTQSSIPGAPGTTNWNAASQAYTDWNAANQYYYPQTAEATTTYNQTT